MLSSFLVASTLFATIPLVTAQGASDQGDHYTGPDAPKGTAHIVNQCDKDYYVYPVTNYHDPKPDEGVLIKKGETKSWPIIIPKMGCQCGTSFKIFPDDTKTGKHTQMEYSLRASGDRNTWALSYDISLVDCSTLQPAMGLIDGFTAYTGESCPGWKNGYKVYGTNGKNCGAMECAGDKFCPWDVYFKDIPGVYQPVRQCDDGSVDADLHFVMCSGSTASAGNPDLASYILPSPDNGPSANSGNTNQGNSDPEEPNTPEPVAPEPPAPAASSSAVAPPVVEAPANFAEQPAAPVPVVITSTSTIAAPKITTVPINAPVRIPAGNEAYTIAPAPYIADEENRGIDSNDVLIVVTTTIFVYPNGERVYPRTYMA